MSDEQVEPVEPVEPVDPNELDDQVEPDEEPEPPEPPAESDWQRRRRLAAVFGDVLPETTSDERGEGDRGAGGNDEWLRRQVPPHHG